MKLKIEPVIKKLPLSRLAPDPENPRDISKEALSGLRASIHKFGYLDLIVVNKRTMQIVSGHQRFKVLKDAGAEEALCIVVDVDAVQQKAISLSMNNQAIMGHWTEAITSIIEKLRQMAPEDYINLRLNELREEVAEFEKESTGAGKTLPDDVPETPKKAETKPGDIWQLGEHRLMCGDSTNPEHVAKLIGREKIKLLATDPPYCVDYDGTGRPSGPGRKYKEGGKNWSHVYHEVDIKDAGKFYESYLKLGLEYSIPNVPVYMWHASKRAGDVQNVFDKLGLLLHQPIIWVKPCHLMTYSVYSWRHEPCAFGWPEGKKPKYRPAMKNVSSVWEIGLFRSGDPTNPEYYTDIWPLDWEGKKRATAKEHPTVKPTEVFAIPMRIHTSPGDLCYEPFSGSGTQIIAGERLYRKVFAMEIEPVFCDVAIRRFEEFTGRHAKLIQKTSP
ncbi:MAG: hypothetical protein COV74_03460 [Candidatus Omnitrophica bacterium CG11_big_fil_rev_8_21_14_0_20_45_26]|uniref:Methyltransferase n=1 Tax=Candidatus Abzuiibacterium crystallinum TaxID=1974748 RepID=A0A2H0LTE7_9BACT|nr:MAG: hypothetical protein COV74_03460 [Candidatus Omnitrophica bacterium CG11_big_fil_rev_8_21_14_0_20_45_26]PIW63322.1 MAG: hypothetical protein COW12_10800 [Candidatus Omnitrophica bacterium CG12_big_fil_rev_8_21_14_0_65_45_16]